MRAWLSPALLVLLSASATGCEGASAQSGLAGYLRLQNAQYMPGELDQSDKAASPEVHRIDSQNNTVYRGIPSKTVSGSVGPGSFAVLIGLQGDSGHWILPVQSVEQGTGDLTFSTKASLSSLTPLGSANLLYRAVDKAGNIGPLTKQSWKITQTDATGEFVVSLDWDTEADLDLRVIAPDATGKEVEIWSRKTSTAIKPQPGEPPLTEADLATVGRLDFDSNSQCVIDGRRQENVYWAKKPPLTNQLYTVRVDAFSMCGEAFAHWRVRVLLDGQEVLSARGQVSDADTRYDHGPGAGLQALQFTY